jgi:hypothetical protein
MFVSTVVSMQVGSIAVSKSVAEAVVEVVSIMAGSPPVAMADIPASTIAVNISSRRFFSPASSATSEQSNAIFYVAYYLVRRYALIFLAILLPGGGVVIPMYSIQCPPVVTNSSFQSRYFFSNTFIAQLITQ